MYILYVEKQFAVHVHLLLSQLKPLHQTVVVKSGVRQLKVNLVQSCQEDLGCIEAILGALCHVQSIFVYRDKLALRL